MFFALKQVFSLRRIVFYSLSLSPLLYFIVNGNFLVDDWGQLSNGVPLVNQISSWQSLWAYRPISWLVLPTILNLFNDNFTLLAILHISLYIFSVFQLVSWEKLNFNLAQKYLASILLLSPVFASTFILSPVNQLSASVSLFLFALGLMCEKTGDKTRRALFMTYFFFLLSLLSYEISLPLIFTHYLFIVLAKPRSILRISVLPVVIALVVFWQKIIAVNLFNSDNSRLDNLSVIPFVSFILTYLVSIPMALIEGVFDKPYLVPAFLVLIAMVFRSFNIREANFSVNRQTKTVLFFGFLSSGLLFLLSGRYSLIDGYQNRGLTSSWILFSLLLISFLNQRKNLIMILILFVVSVNYVLFVGKIGDSVQAGEVRKTVVTQILDKELLVNGSSSTIILDLPCLLPTYSFRTEIFCASWDARGALVNKGLGFDDVFVTGDTEDSLSRFLSVSRAQSDVQVVKFNDVFEIVRIDFLTPETQENLVRQVELNMIESEAKIEACKAKIAQLMRFQISGSLSEYLSCARHPLS